MFKIQNAWFWKSVPIGNGYITSTTYAPDTYFPDIEKLSFTTESITHPANLNYNRVFGCGFNSSVKGYIHGGGGWPGLGAVPTESLTFTTDTVSVLDLNYSNAGSRDTGLNSRTNGYICTQGRSIPDCVKLSFATETKTVAANLNTPVENAGGFSTVSCGYICGGNLGGVVLTSLIQKIEYTTDTWTTISTFLRGPVQYQTGVASKTKGYSCGGHRPYANIIAQIDDWVFATELAQNTASSLSRVKLGAAGVYSSKKGYICGGSGHVLLAIVDSLNFTTETCAEIGSTSKTHPNSTGFQSGGTL